MACQKHANKVGMIIYNSEGKFTKPHPYIFFITVANWCEKDAGYIIPTLFAYFDTPTSLMFFKAFSIWNILLEGRFKWMMY